MRKSFLLLLFISQLGFAQERTADSLRTLIEQAQNDSIKIDLYNKMIWLYIFNDQEKARESFKEVEKIAQRKGQEYGFNSLLNVKGVFYDVIGETDSAKEMFLQSLRFSRKHQFHVHEEHTLNNLGMFCWNKGDNEQALDYYFQSLKHAERFKGNYDRKDATYNNIGLIYQDMELFDKAIKYHKIALALRIKSRQLHEQAVSYNNLGICYTNLGKYDEAEKMLLKGKAISSSGKDKILYYETVQSLANLYMQQRKYDKAYELFLASYNRPSTVAFNPNKKVSTLSGLAQLAVKKNNILMPSDMARSV